MERCRLARLKTGILIYVTVWTLRLGTLIFSFGFLLAVFFVLLAPGFLWAKNINQYRDVISNSAPATLANHTLSFRIGTALAPGSVIEITPPPGFETIGTSTFSADRNVELRVNGSLRNSNGAGGPAIDLVEIIPGLPGLIRYTLNNTTGINGGSDLDLRIGNHTSKKQNYSEFFDEDTMSTTTILADTPGIINASSTGTHKVAVRIFSGGPEVAKADFSIVVLPRVGVGPADTTEEDPPQRFNGAPSTTITGVTLNVEIFVETDERAICKYALVPGVSYFAMPFTFTGTGLIYHTAVVPVTPNSLQQFYVRCIDDEGNFNIDDYLIEFSVSDRPTGSANEEGDVQGDGTGTGNQGTGDGSGSGGTTGNSSGEAPLLGGSAGTGGTGGGGGGGSGSVSGGTAGGGFETIDGPYRSGDGRVTITGYAFPRSQVTVLVDGREATRINANSSGEYTVTLDQIARGVYTFGLFATGPDQARSSTFSTSFTVTGARTSALSNINIPPSITVRPDPVDPGTPVAISGYALPNATITLENEREGVSASRQTLTTTSDTNGQWSISVPTNGFSVGTYKVRARAGQVGGVSTNFSNYTLYGVGQAAVRPISADLNRDGKVNLIDFSILLFWWNTDGGNSDPSADINGDGRVNLTDFSILLFNWTG